MKRFVIFGGSNWYPSGGGYDYLSEHDSLDEALTALPTPSTLEASWSCAWTHVWDAETRQMVRSFREAPVKNSSGKSERDDSWVETDFL